MNLSEFLAAFVLVACREAANRKYYFLMERDQDCSDRHDWFFQAALTFHDDVRAISEVLDDVESQRILGGGGGGRAYAGES